MSLQGKKLGILIAAAPDAPNFRHGIGLAETALRRGATVYLYCIDEAVSGLADAQLQELKSRGANLFACAYGAHRRQLPISELATFAGLTVVNDLIAGTDRFLCFS
jgi:hypothetical protein